MGKPGKQHFLDIYCLGRTPRQKKQKQTTTAWPARGRVLDRRALRACAPEVLHPPAPQAAAALLHEGDSARGLRDGPHGRLGQLEGNPENRFSTKANQASIQPTSHQASGLKAPEPPVLLHGCFVFLSDTLFAEFGGQPRGTPPFLGVP